MEIADHIACLRSEGELLAEAAERSGLSTPVPTCPGWRLRDLLAHLGFVHRWACSYVAEGRTDMSSEPEDEIIRLAPADESLVGWFRDGHARLVSGLAAADPAVCCWAFLPAPSPLAFWARRQAHETAIHRADAQLAAAAAGAGADLDPFPPGLAADGVDELLMGFGGRNPGSLSTTPATLVIRAKDGVAAAEWTVVMGQPHAGVSRGSGPAAGPAHAGLPGRADRADPAAGRADPAEGPADSQAGRADPAAGRGDAGPTGPASAYCQVTGPASALYLLLWNRGTAAGLDIRGDAGVLATWRENMRVRWS
jgi:uncharacterized protein (TIGR03083 family)